MPLPTLDATPIIDTARVELTGEPGMARVVANTKGAYSGAPLTQVVICDYDLDNTFSETDTDWLSCLADAWTTKGYALP
jgi:hypothetical protein